MSFDPESKEIQLVSYNMRSVDGFLMTTLQSRTPKFIYDTKNCLDAGEKYEIKITVKPFGKDINGSYRPHTETFTFQTMSIGSLESPAITSTHKIKIPDLDNYEFEFDNEINTSGYISSIEVKGRGIEAPPTKVQMSAPQVEDQQIETFHHAYSELNVDFNNEDGKITIYRPNESD